MRAGASKPDVSSIDAFRRTLLDARSIAYTEADTGAHFESVLQRLGIAEEVKAKAVLRVGGVSVAQAVANGDAELGVTVISNIVLTRGADVAGPLPAGFRYVRGRKGSVARGQIGRLNENNEKARTYNAVGRDARKSGSKLSARGAQCAIAVS